MSSRLYAAYQQRKRHVYAHNGQVHSRPILPQWQQSLARLLVCVASGLLLNRAVRQRIAVQRFNALSRNWHSHDGETLPTML